MKTKNLLLILFVAVSMLAPVLSCNAGEVRNYSGFTVTLPDGWRFGNDQYYLDFHHPIDPSHMFGFFNSALTDPGQTARQVAEEFRQMAIEKEEQVSEVYDHYLGGYGGLKAALYYTYDVHPVDGRAMTNEHLYAIRGESEVSLFISCPSDLWKKPGVLDDVDYIVNNVRFW